MHSTVISSLTLFLTWKVSVTEPKGDEIAVFQYALRGSFTEEVWLFNVATLSSVVLHGSFGFVYYISG